MNEKYMLTTQDVKNLKKIKNKIKKDYGELHIFFLSISSIVGWQILNDHEPRFDKVVLVHFDEYENEHIIHSLKQAARLILKLEEDCMHSDEVTTSFNEKESWIEVAGLYPYTDLLYTLEGAADFIKKRYGATCELRHIKYKRNTVENHLFFTEKDMQEYLLEHGYENNPAFIIYSERIELSPEVKSVIKLITNTNLKEVLTKQ
jgi:hypothetical protein